MNFSPAGLRFEGTIRVICIALILALVVGCASTPVPVLTSHQSPPTQSEQTGRVPQTESGPQPQEVDWAAVAWITAALILLGVLIANSTQSTVRGQSG